MMRKPYLPVLLFLNVVFCAATNKVTTLEVTEGETVTLDTCCADVNQDKDDIEWRFVPDDAVIAKNGVIYDTLDGKFTDLLSLNPQSGDLEIRNVRTQHSGVYEGKINSSERTVHVKFNVFVLDALPAKLSATEGISVKFPCNAAVVQKYDWITWIFENTTIAEIKQKSPSPDYVKEGRFRGRLQMDDQTRCLTITDVKSTDSGLYKLQVISQNQNLKIRAYRLTVTTSVSPAVYVVPILLLLVAIVAAVIIYKKFFQRRADTGDAKAVDEPLTKGQK